MSCASIHLRTADLEAVRAELERILEPNFSAYIAVDTWISVFPEELETHDPDDLKRLGVPLSKGTPVIAFLGEDDDLEVWRFPEAHGEHVDWDDLKARAEVLGIPPHHVTHFDALSALEDDGALPEGFVRLEREPEKPGLKEFFGRSQDE